MKKETNEEASERMFPHHKGRTILASNKTMLRRSAFVKGAKWKEETNKNIEKAFYSMINTSPIIFSEKGLCEIKKIYGLKTEQWKIKSINYDFEIEIESESHFIYSGLGLDLFIF